VTVVDRREGVAIAARDPANELGIARRLFDRRAQGSSRTTPSSHEASIAESTPPPSAYPQLPIASAIGFRKKSAEWD